ncbi:endonuclease [Pseudoalteromonas sp. R3]|uniref:endonuclease n=2 Tax=Pseudoalteromonas sp. R3 TaxID=1709477 RepID=UPI0009EA56F4|nr:endonuclease I [Pseudoalteromonas sp. R3]
MITRKGPLCLTMGLAGSALSLLSTMAWGQVDNGDFEQWQLGKPSNWTTIDSGISLTTEQNRVHSGQTAAAVNVLTTTQGNTDLAQTVTVEAGKTYTFSTWVYHTEGGVRARLVADGYHNYSDPQQLNQWQQLSHDYTATSNGQITVGLRFYDVSGFDGNETVYVDNFQPSGTTGTPPPTGGTCQANALTFNLTTDKYGEETSWVIKNASNTTVASGKNYGASQNYTENLCLTDGSYTFTISDSYGDGICCSYGNGSYSLNGPSGTIASGSQFTSSASHSFTLGTDNGGGDGGGDTPTGYYSAAAGLSGYALKTALHNIIASHNNQGYGAIWSFIDQYERDRYFENNGTVLDRYSEKPTGTDSHEFTAVGDQCGTARVEGDCYNREHSFPKSWFGGKIEPMNSDIHHIFASDGYVNNRRSSFPFGEVGSSTYVSSNGSKVGSASGIGYSGTVFEPIDQFKGDFARAYFYMATRYQDRISGWQNNSSYSDAVLNGSSDQVFEAWVVAMLKRWHQADPVDALERARNEGAYQFQGNRNPFVDHPEFVEQIW